MITTVVLITMIALAIGYRFYGNYLVDKLELDDSRKTPAVEFEDGEDFVPAKPSLLLGQHFSAIAAAGPIVGPILAGIWFGWVPAILWIILGSIFIGGVHDMSAMVASLRHKGASVGELVKSYMSPSSHKLFLVFVWLALVYVIVAFTDITAQTFKTVAGDVAFGPGVAVSSFFYLALGVVMGVSLHKFKANLAITTALCLPVVMLIVWAGPKFPASILGAVGSVSVKQWDVILLGYCFVASLIPVWMLLQPRGYLGGWFLYLTIGASLIGTLFGGFDVQYPAFNTEGLKSVLNGKPLMPLLFITVACGACSGFHGIVSSGTTSKQIDKESSALPVGYGAMLLEALVAVLALSSVMMLAAGDESFKGDPSLIYAKGIARYMGLLGIDFSVAFSFALLAFSTFVYDTLDVCTRLARYVLQELLGLKDKKGAVIATTITLLVPLVILMLAKEKAYLAAWPIFGTSNQLMASLTLMAVAVWLHKKGKNPMFAIVPMAFMSIMTVSALVLQIKAFVKALAGDAPIKTDVYISGGVGVVLLALSAWLFFEAGRILLERKRESEA